MNKKYLAYGTISAIAITASAILAIGTASADTLKAANNPMSGLVNAIAQKFNLNPTDVQQVFDTQRTQMEANRQANMKQELQTRLSAAVTAGKLTQVQADAITAKVAELQATKPDFTGKTKAEIEAAMKAQQDALKQWAASNNLPAEYLRFLGGRGGPGMGFGPMGHKAMGTTPAASN